MLHRAPIRLTVALLFSATLSIHGGDPLVGESVAGPDAGKHVLLLADAKKNESKQVSGDAQPSAQTAAQQRPSDTPDTPSTVSLVEAKPARFVRIELPGDKRILTLAEVEVFSDGRNIASDGKATSIEHSWRCGRGKGHRQKQES